MRVFINRWWSDRVKRVVRLMFSAVYNNDYKVACMTVTVSVVDQMGSRD